MHFRRDTVRWRRYGEQISDHYLVESDQRVVNAPGPARGPVPIQKVTLWILAVPVPFDRLPQMRDPAVERNLVRTRTVEVLARREQPLHQERCFHQIAPVIEHPKDRHSLSRAA